MEKLYRAEVRSINEVYSPSIEFKEYDILAETKCGYWFEKHGKKTFVLKGSGKRFCHSTKSLALQYLIERRKRYAHLLKIFSARNDKVLNAANQFLINPDYKNEKLDFIF